MKTFAAILGACWLASLVGCSKDSDTPIVPQVSDVGRSGGPPAAIPPSDSERESERAIQETLPHGPADSKYHEPMIGVAGPELAITTSGRFDLRPWAGRTITYPNVRLAHEPLWLEDPLASQDLFGHPACEPAAGFYSVGRFWVNMVGLPVTIVVHPFWERAVTDRTPVLPPTAPCDTPMVAPATQPGY